MRSNEEACLLKMQTSYYSAWSCLPPGRGPHRTTSTTLSETGGSPVLTGRWVFALCACVYMCVCVICTHDRLQLAAQTFYVSVCKYLVSCRLPCYGRSGTVWHLPRSPPHPHRPPVPATLGPSSGSAQFGATVKGFDFHHSPGSRLWSLARAG